MSNTNMDVLYPEFWAASFDALDIGEYGLPALVSRDVEPLIANSGDTVNVPITPDLGTADDWTPGDTISGTGITQQTVPVTLDKSKKKTITLNGAELSKSPYDLIQMYGVPLAKTILKAVNLDLYLTLLKTDNFVDARAGVSEDFIVDAGVKLDENEADPNSRRLVMSPGMMGALLKLDAFQHADASGDPNAQRDLALIRKFGFDMHKNSGIAKYTPADLTGAVNNKGTAYAAGAVSIAVDGFDDDANPIRPGDMFTLSGESGTPLHTVISTTKSSSDTVEITFLPALAGATPAADDAVVTFVATQSLVGFTPSAVAFAARQYAQLPVGGVNQAMVTVGGVPVRISVWHDGNLGLNVQYDTLYGSKVINKNRIVRILEDA